MSGPGSPASRELFRSRRPRLTGVVAILLAILLAVVAAVLFGVWANAGVGAVVGPASAAVLLALLSALVAIIAFQVAARPAEARTLLGPLQLFTILIALIGFAAAVLGLVFGAVTESIFAIGAGIGVFVASLLAAFLGASVYGAGAHRP